MTKKRTWIKIHSGLTNDPKHRARLGVRVWLFMWLIDQVDWTTGIVWDYTDKRAADNLSEDDAKISPRTIEDQRQQLEKDGYIVCHPSFQCQHIRIMRWRDPREVSPPQINVPDQRDTWYDVSRRHGTETPVPIPAGSTVPLHIDHTITQWNTALRDFWEAEIKQPLPGQVFFEKLDYRVETHGIDKVKRCMLKANEYGKAHNLPYLDSIIAGDNGAGKHSNGKREVPREDDPRRFKEFTID